MLTLEILYRRRAPCAFQNPSTAMKSWKIQCFTVPAGRTILNFEKNFARR